MENAVYHFYIRPQGPRPDYRVVKAFLWSDAQNVDSDGDSYNPASREWTYLFLCNRENEAEMIMVDRMPPGSPLILEIKSTREYMAARCAYFLAMQTNSNIAETLMGDFYSPSDLARKMGVDFDFGAAMERAKQSRYSRSTLDNPYPERVDSSATA